MAEYFRKFPDNILLSFNHCWIHFFLVDTDWVDYGVHEQDYDDDFSIQIDYDSSVEEFDWKKTLKKWQIRSTFLAEYTTFQCTLVSVSPSMEAWSTANDPIRNEQCGRLAQIVLLALRHRSHASLHFGYFWLVVYLHPYSV